MPPKKKAAATPAAPPTPLLLGCHISLAGTFSGRTHASLEAHLKSLGAVITKSVTKATTHVISSRGEYYNPISSKCLVASGKGIPVIGYEWVEDCEKSGRQVQESDYTWEEIDKRTNNTASATSATSATSVASPAAGSIGSTVQANGIAQSGASRTNGSKNSKKRPIAAVNTDDMTTATASNGNKDSAKHKRTKKGGDDSVDDDAAKDNGPPQKIDTDKEVEKSKGKKSSKDVANGQIALSKEVQIPLDEGCTMTSYLVYIDDNNVIYDASLSQTVASSNNNKFYRIQVCHQFANLTIPLSPLLSPLSSLSLSLSLALCLVFLPS
jgi:poly [ADP-ribose] polymerase 2/3/4